MARTLSDTIIVAMIEAATRLSGGRGSIAGVAAQTAPRGTNASGESLGRAGQAAGVTAAAGAGSGRAADGATQQVPAEHDTRTAEQIGADFKTIYTQIEDVVRTSAEQETKSVGFSVRSP